MYMYLLLYSISVLFHFGLSVVVDTKYGHVRGHRVNVLYGQEAKTIDVFNGIPFAKDTSGSRRFQKPEEPDAWTEIFEADTLGDLCVQGGLLIDVTHPNWTRFSEDCLNLNIYSPQVNGGPYPVMVWIHGGGYQGGGNIKYPGHFLAARDVVVVTLNYRLGPFGFAYTGNDACPGNAGLWDQKLALEFVRDSIANFGGNPNEVTLIGQSAGATSVSQLLLSPLTKDLFHQAIIMSGAETNFWGYSPPASNPEDYTHEIAEQLGCVDSDDYAMIECMQGKSADDISNTTFSCAPGYFCLGMVPVVDGEGGILPKTPAELREEGNIMLGPIMAGIARDDGSLFLPIVVPESLFGCCNRTYFHHVLKTRFAELFAPVGADNVTRENIFRALDYNYSPWPYVYDTDANRQQMAEVITDLMFGEPWDTLINNHQTVATTYGYVFDYASANYSGLLDWMAVTHSDDNGYIWGYPLLQYNEDVQQDSLMFGTATDYTQEDAEFSMFIQELYTNFVKFGNPTPQPVPNPFGGFTVWPEFTYDDMHILYYTNESVYVENEWRQKDYAFWSEYIPYLTGNSEPADTYIDDDFMDERDAFNQLMAYTFEYAEGRLFD